MPGDRLTPQQRADIAADIRDTAGSSDGSVRRIAARHHVGMGTVRRVAVDIGLNNAWRDGAYQTEAATAQKAAHLAERRRNLQADLLDDVEEIRERLLNDVIHLNVVKNGMADGGSESVEQTELPPAGRDFQAMAGAIAALTKSHLDIERLELENSGTGQAGGLLATFTDELRAARVRRDQETAAADPEQA